MHSETAIESRAEGRGRRRKRGNGTAAAGGPVFVDTSGRRSRALRRIGLLVGVGCAGYAAVLVMAFMGWGTSLNPSSLLPSFGDGQSSSRQGPGFEPQGGIGGRTGTPSGTPSFPSSPSSPDSSSSLSPSPSSATSTSSSSSATSTSSGDAS